MNLGNLLNHKVTCHVKDCTKLAFQVSKGVGKFGFPLFIVFPKRSLVNISNLKACHDANKNAKSGKILRIFHYQVRDVTQEMHIAGRPMVPHDLL